MRTVRDRLRHVISFEIIGLALSTPLAAWVFGVPPLTMGTLAVACSLIAISWNYVYNLGFDVAMLRLRGSTKKTLPIRFLHTGVFQAVLVVILILFIAWFLAIGLRSAVVMQAGFLAFYGVYAFVFNLAYDWLFPVEDERATEPR
jgi:uncharacterized membrane protein